MNPPQIIGLLCKATGFCVAGAGVLGDLPGEGLVMVFRDSVEFSDWTRFSSVGVVILLMSYSS